MASPDVTQSMAWPLRKNLPTRLSGLSLVCVFLVETHQMLDPFSQDLVHHIVDARDAMIREPRILLITDPRVDMPPLPILFGLDLQPGEVEPFFGGRFLNMSINRPDHGAVHLTFEVPGEHLPPEMPVPDVRELRAFAADHDVVLLFTRCRWPLRGSAAALFNGEAQELPPLPGLVLVTPAGLISNRLHRFVVTHCAGPVVSGVRLPQPADDPLDLGPLRLAVLDALPGALREGWVRTVELSETRHVPSLARLRAMAQDVISESAGAAALMLSTQPFADGGDGALLSVQVITLRALARLHGRELGIDEALALLAVLGAGHRPSIVRNRWSHESESDPVIGYAQAASATWAVAAHADAWFRDAEPPSSTVPLHEDEPPRKKQSTPLPEA